MLHPKTDLGGHITAVHAGGNKTGGAAALFTAGGAGDNEEVVGPSIDLLGFQSGALVTSSLSNCSAAESTSLRVRMEQSADNSSWDAIETVRADTVQATSAGGGTVTGIQKDELNFKSMKRYVRFSFTWNFTKANTDDVTFGAALVCGGDDTLIAA